MSEHPIIHPVLVDYEAAFFEGGEEPWGKPQALPTGPDKVESFMIRMLPLPASQEQFIEYCRGVHEIAHYPGCAGTYHATDDRHFYVVVPRHGYEDQLRPRIVQHQAQILEEQGVPTITTNSAVANKHDAILEERVRSLLFDNDTRAWVHTTDAFEGNYRRVIPVEQMHVGTSRYDFHRDILPLAQRLLQQETGLDSLRGFATSGSSGVLSLPAHDFPKLAERIGKNNGTDQNSTISHIDRYRERQRLKLSETHRGYP